MIRDTNVVNSTDLLSGNGGEAPIEGRRSRKARLTRRALLDAGLAAFERQPPALVSVLDITEAADVAKGVFYLHFASKDAFLLALWEDVQRTFLEQVRRPLLALEAASGVRDSDPNIARVITTVHQYALFAVRFPQHVSFALRMSSMIGNDIGAPGELLQRRTRHIEDLTHVLASSQHPSPKWRSVAMLMDANCWGVIWQAQKLNQPIPTEEDLVALVLPGIKPLLNGLRSS